MFRVTNFHIGHRSLGEIGEFDCFYSGGDIYLRGFVNPMPLNNLGFEWTTHYMDDGQTVKMWYMYLSRCIKNEQVLEYFKYRGSNGLYLTY